MAKSEIVKDYIISSFMRGILVSNNSCRSFMAGVDTCIAKQKNRE